MRQDILDYIQSIPLGSFSLTQELPWDSNGMALYIKNPKRIYVDRTQHELEPIVQTLDALQIANEIQIVRVYFSSDAKLLPSGYDDLVDNLKLAKNINNTVGFRDRQCIINTSFQEDLLITELEFRFTKIT